MVYKRGQDMKKRHENWCVCGFIIFNDVNSVIIYVV